MYYKKDMQNLRYKPQETACRYFFARTRERVSIYQTLPTHYTPFFYISCTSVWRRFSTSDCRRNYWVLKSFPTRHTACQLSSGHLNGLRSHSIALSFLIFLGTSHGLCISSANQSMDLVDSKRRIPLDGGLF
jgi:hypothetical protein